MNNKSILIVLIAVVILGAILFFAFGNSDDGAVNMPNTITDNASTSQQVADYTAQQNAQNQNTTNTNTTTNTTPVNSVVLAETPAGNFATVAQAYLTRSGYVVFHLVNSNGDSSIIGKTDLLAAGSHANVKVQLDTPLAYKQAVVAVLHEDDGDGKFEYPESDGYLVNANGFFVSDIDVVDVSRSDAESKVLEAQVATFMENNFDTNDTSN